LLHEPLLVAPAKQIHEEGLPEDAQLLAASRPSRRMPISPRGIR
jgi:hypothetical protein